MSSLICEVCKIDKVKKHPNADKLDIIIIKGWQTITQKDKYKEGDIVIYIPIDSVVPYSLAERVGITSYLFNIEKELDGIKPKNGRIRTIKLRGEISQGLIIDNIGDWKVGKDVKEELGITKYDPDNKTIEEINVNNSNKLVRIIKKYNYLLWKKHIIRGKQLPTIPDFIKYTDIQNFKNYPNIIEDGEEVVITEKIHGTNFRCMNAYISQVIDHISFIDRVKLQLKNLFFKLKKEKLIGFKLVGSHNCNLRENRKDLYWRVSNIIDMSKIKLGYEIFGEIYGNGIQYLHYDKERGIGIRIFDITDNGRYLDYDKFIKELSLINLQMVPVLYDGKFDRKILKELSQGRSMLGDNIKEGCVIRLKTERYDCRIGRVILKYINDEYLAEQTKRCSKKSNKEDIYSH